MIRVAIVDDHAIVRAGLKQYFADQVDLWQRGLAIPMPLTAAAVAAQFPTRQVLMPGPHSVPPN